MIDDPHGLFDSNWIKTVAHGLFQASMWRRYAMEFRYAEKIGGRDLDYLLYTLRLGGYEQCKLKAKEALRQVKVLREREYSGLHTRIRS